MGFVLPALLLSYLLGALPSSIIIGRTFYGLDVRETGSKNPGATNVFRVLGWRAGLTVLLMDVLKGLLPATLASYLLQTGSLLFEPLAWLLPLMAILGHVTSPFLGFRGGKGVATGMGAVLGMAPEVALVLIGVFLVVFLATGMVSPASLLSAAAFPVVFALQGESAVPVAFAVVLAALVFYTHRKNISRLLRGEENRFRLPWLKNK